MKQLLALLVLCLALTALPAAPAQADTAAGEPLLFAETGHTLAYAFRQFYERNGGLPIFGLPISEVFIENGLPVQYFERARFEWHATLAMVQAGHLGRWAAADRMAEPPFQALERAPVTGMFFPETGHSLDGDFLRYWRANGGLAVFGYPLSEAFVELNATDGRSYTVQYFERARFEWHPELPAGQQVQLGHLGRQYLAQAASAPAWALQPVATADAAWQALRPSHISIPRIGVDTGIETAGFSYGSWDVPRYNAVQYWPISGYPGLPGNVVVAGHVGYRDIIFNYLPAVQAGDEIFVQVADDNHRYVVQEVLTLLPSETWVMYPTQEETLTLITCIPIGVYSHRLIVRATPASS